MKDKPDDDEVRIVRRGPVPPPTTRYAATDDPKADDRPPAQAESGVLRGCDLQLAALKAAERDLKDFALRYRSLSVVPAQKETARLIRLARRPSLRVLSQPGDRGPDDAA